MSQSPTLAEYAPINAVLSSLQATSGETSTSSVVWQTRTNTSTAFVLSWTSERTPSIGTTQLATYTAISTRKYDLGLKDNLMILADQETKTLTVLAHSWLSPYETPINSTNYMRSIPYPDNVNVISKLSTLDNRGGVYAATLTSLVWIPIIKPFSIEPPSATDPQAASIYTFQGTIVAMVLLLDLNTMFVIEYNQTIPAHILWKINANGNQVLTLDNMQQFLLLNDSVTTLPLQNNPEAVSAVTVNPNNGHVYISTRLGKTIIIDATTKTLIGLIQHSFSTVNMIDMDTNGQYLYIGGSDLDNGVNRGRLDDLNLVTNNLSPNFGASAFLHRPFFAMQFLLPFFLLCVFY